MGLNVKEAGPDCHVLSVAVKYVPLCPPPSPKVLFTLVSCADGFPGTMSLFSFYIYIFTTIEIVFPRDLLVMVDNCNRWG